MQYQTFKPTILNDTTNQVRQTVKFVSTKSEQNTSVSNEHKISVAKQLETLEYLQEIEEQKSIIEGQNQFIQILRNSIESKLQIDGFQMILDQVLEMSREQKIDLFALITQLYQELSVQNQNNGQVENLQQLVDNLNKQINCYAKELTELKVDKQYLLDQLDQMQGATKDDDTVLFKEAQIQKLESEKQHLKIQLQQQQQQNEKQKDDLEQLEKRLNRIHLNLKTEECEKEELLKELENLRSTFYKSQVKEEHKLELNISLKEQEIEYQNNRIKKLESKIKELNDLIEEQQKQIGAQKYQIENLQQQHQLQYDQLEIEMNQYRSEIHEQSMFSESLQQQLSVSEQFIQQIINELARLANLNESDIFKIIQKLQENLSNQVQNEQKLKQSEQEKSQIIFDLQHQVSDAQQTNQQLSEQIQVMSVQLQQYQNDLKLHEKGKRMFRQEIAHLKQLNEQKNEEIKDLECQFSKYDKKLAEQVEKSLKIDKENSSLKEQLNIAQNQLNNAKNQISNKKSMSFSQTSFTEAKIKNFDYIALLQTFEKVKPLFSLEALELVQEMLTLQNKLVRVDENVDTQLIQEEIKLQQKIAHLQNNQKNLQVYLAKLIQENKKLKLEIQMNQPQSQSQECLSYDQFRGLQRFHKQSMSVHTKPKLQ